jgi:phytoene synthase
VTSVTFSVAPWEERLLDLAYQPLASADKRHPRDEPAPIAADARTLADAYAHSAALTQRHSKTFYLASGLLPAGMRPAVRALYAFCRVSDDLVDVNTVDRLGDVERGVVRRRLERLEAWRRRALSDHPPDDDPVALAWADTRARYRIPVGYAHQLLDSVAQDLRVTRYTTFDDLAEYAYGVASTVGLMVMHIIGFKGEEAVPSAVKLGVALQLTNILRDVGEDWRKGRLYLPLDELNAFGLSETDVAKGMEGNVGHRWRALMRFQIARNCRLYAEALPGIAMLHPDGRFAIAAAAELYRAILDDVEAHDYDVFARRSYVSWWGKLRRLPGIWWRTRAVRELAQVGSA